MEELTQGFSKKIWLKWVVLAVIVLITTLSLVNYYQISTLKMEVGEVKTSLNKIEPVVKILETLKATISPVPTSIQNQPIEIVGTIQRSEIEGGCWYIDPNWPCEGEKCPLGLMASYEPINLPKELQKTGLKAKFQLEVLPDVATICQIGPAVKILDYQIIK